MRETRPCVYLKLKLVLKDGQTRDKISAMLESMNYSSLHDEIIEHELLDVIETPFYRSNRINPFDMIQED